MKHRIPTILTDNLNCETLILNEDFSDRDQNFLTFKSALLEN